MTRGMYPRGGKPHAALTRVALQKCWSKPHQNRFDSYLENEKTLLILLVLLLSLALSIHGSKDVTVIISSLAVSESLCRPLNIRPCRH